ncbi:MAG: phosphatidylserine decarboxylase [bacterium]|nr:phosphatidylserine decarboxylase [bacterium]
MLYDLKNKVYIDSKKTNSGLRFLYNTFIGRFILKIMISKLPSIIYSFYMNSRFSKYKIKSFIRKNNINIDEYEEKTYNSFNDFFTRKIKKESRLIEDGLVAVSDGKLLVYKIDDNSSFKIKNSIYTVSELIGCDDNCYKGGYALIFRLDVDDYHHYIFPDKGYVVSKKHINGSLHTVQPLAFKKYKVFLENTREVTHLKCENLGDVCYIEVGAMMIGKITNKKITKFNKGEYKGHFEFGGSTVIMLIKNKDIKINKKILDNSKKGIETIVKLGSSLE